MVCSVLATFMVTHALDRCQISKHTWAESGPKMLTVESLVQALLNAVNRRTGWAASFPVGAVLDPDQHPLCVIDSAARHEGGGGEAYGESLLAHLAAGRYDMVEALLNLTPVSGLLFSAPLTRSARRPLCRPMRLQPSVWVPVADTPADLVRVILLLAHLHPTPAGDLWAHRVLRCTACQNFFLGAQRRPSRFCSKLCRNRGAV